ncbi:hypothetical protein [Klebsiella aerogenes]|uniref:hypothetical protein n=1 Tax=Klebsiella aerogenes TaxID=548 RepID=UPI0022796E4C|nr:hypothetical protein [Klebsiella aerogenes]MCY4762693.1 hypothetical protein [Klebsiella aerogenes]HBT3063124.1 hypothetical protein [Klebsiella aerogenes]
MKINEVLKKYFNVEADNAEIIMVGSNSEPVSYSIEADNKRYNLVDVIGDKAYWTGLSQEEFLNSL